MPKSGRASNLPVATIDGGAVAPLAFPDNDGAPCTAALEVMIPFSDYNQKVQVRKDFGSAALEAGTGRTLRARVAGGRLRR